MDVSPERTRWRDEKISIRHKIWGFDCPAVDIDFPMVEYNQRVPVATIEYKAKTVSQSWVDADASCQALGRLRVEDPSGEVLPLPFFVVTYSTDSYTFYAVHPGNETAHSIFDQYEMAKPYLMPEEQYVRFLYWLRGMCPPPHVMKNLKWLTKKPELRWWEFDDPAREIRQLRNGDA